MAMSPAYRVESCGTPRLSVVSRSQALATCRLGLGLRVPHVGVILVVPVSFRLASQGGIRGPDFGPNVGPHFGVHFLSAYQKYIKGGRNSTPETAPKTGSFFPIIFQLPRPQYGAQARIPACGVHVSRAAVLVHLQSDCMKWHQRLFGLSYARTHTSHELHAWVYQHSHN